MKPSVGKRIIDRLQSIVDAVENKQPLSERFTCRNVVLSLDPTHYDKKRVKETRELLGASQAVFARLLGVSVKTVRSWEQGVTTPKDIACRFMDEIRRNPGYWVQRLKESASAR